ncbi:MAG: EAL domain-containing protein, partial [Sphingobium sp.]
MATLTRNAVKSGHLGADFDDAAEAPIDGIAHVRAFIRMENYFHVVTAYGQIVADELLKEVYASFNASLGGEIGAIPGSGSSGFAVNLIRAAGESAHSLGKHFATLLQTLCVTTMSQSFNCADELVHPILSCSRVAVNGKRCSADDQLLRFDGEAPRQGATWAIGYHNDMAAATGLLAELAENRLCVRWQPIAPTDESGGFLFQEASICSVDLLHERVSQQAEIEAAERVGLSRIIDRWSVEQVLESLRSRPFAQLGVRISAPSAVVDGWWSDIFDHLGRNVDHAQRLTFVVSG